MLLIKECSSSVGPPILQAANFSNLPHYMMFMLYVWNQVSADINQLLFPHCQPVRDILEDVKTCFDSKNLFSCPLISSKRLFLHGSTRTNHNSICDAVVNRYLVNLIKSLSGFRNKTLPPYPPEITVLADAKSSHKTESFSGRTTTSATAWSLLIK